MTGLIRAFGTLRRTPWYSVTVVAVLADGLSLTTVVFAVADGVLFKPLPYARPGELHLIRAIAPTPQGPRPSPMPRRDVEAWTASVPELRLPVVGLPSHSDGQPDGSTGPPASTSASSTCWASSRCSAWSGVRGMRYSAPCRDAACFQPCSFCCTLRTTSRQSYPPPVEADFVVKEFLFESGETLPEVRLHYRTVGTERRDADGVVRNGVLFLKELP